MIESILCLSTAHITQETAKTLEHPEDIGYVLVKGMDEYGWTICTEYYEDLDKIPEDLKLVLDYASQLGCRFVNLDSGEDIIPDLPTYEWWD